MSLWNVLASFGSGFLGAMGFGGGGILIIYLTQILKYGQLPSQGMNLIFFIPSAVVALIIHTKNKLIEFKRILPFLLSALPGVALGLYLTTVISGSILSKIFGAILIIMGTRELFNKSKKD
ncbi:MAG: sulfite exporter TauE/SafE family protein [Clostridia bacterium]|nr:sulfite exporter TauE/SafE family protein [Clostridia bacterium]